MKVEYPLQLFQSFNKRIWNNKAFSYFLIAFVIGYTVFLRSLPELYYKYMMNPLILTIIITWIMIISVHNLQLGLLLIVSLIALYYPKQKYNEIMIQENFDNQTLPIDKYDKNIVDEKKKSTKTKNKKDNLEEDFEDEEKDTEGEEKDAEDDTKEEEDDTKEEKDAEDNTKEEDDTKEEKDEKDVDEEDDNKISEMRLENLNPSLYKKKTNNTNNTNNTNKSNKSNNSNNSNKSNKVVENLTDLKKKTKSSGNEETFLGEVRQIVKDLDTGKNKMNANSAIKKISNLMYHKHKGDIQKIINREESEEEDDDEDYY
jgi:uncharacterized membrane protein